MCRPLFARWRALPIWIAFLAFALAIPALAQTDVTTSRISGTVKDVDGGALPGTTVEARNLETGLTSAATSRADGFYQIINLPTGKYSVTATLSGFRTGVQPDVRIDIGTAATVDFKLSLGTSEAVTVAGIAPTVEVTNTSASTTIQTEQLKNLPVNGRNYQDLILLTPETRKDPEGRGTVLVSGQRGINTNTTLDGVDFDNGS